MSQVPYLDEETVRRNLTMRELIPAIEGALGDLSGGRVVQPVRTVVPVAAHGGYLGVMPASGKGLGAKLVTFYPNNKGIHTHHAVIVLFKPETGEPLVMMDGRLITEMRTAAASAVAANHLARRDAATLALIGAGVQARSHLEAFRLVREIREVRVWSPNSAKAFAAEHGVTAASSAEEAVRGADLVVVATTSKTPVVMGKWISPGTHVTTVGASRPDWRELDDDLVRSARIYVDSRAAAVVESGDVIASPGLFAEIGEVVNGTKPGRQSPDEVTIFKSLGVAVEDVVTGGLVHRNFLGK